MEEEEGGGRGLLWWVFSEYGKYYADLLPRTKIFLLIDMVQYAIIHNLEVSIGGHCLCVK
jgi:hypothetical protein